MAGLDGSSDFKHPDNLHTTASEKDLQLIFSKTKAKQGEKSNASADDSMFVPTSHRYTGPQHYGAASAGFATSRILADARISRYKLAEGGVDVEIRFEACNGGQSDSHKP